jgi:hypothetical protein
LSRALAVHDNAAIAGGLTQLDFARPPEAEQIARALRYARLVIGCKPIAVAGSFGASVEKAETEMCDMLRSYSENVVEQLRTDDASCRAQIEIQFDLVVKLTAMLFSEAQAELLSGRGRIATTTRARR